MWVGVLCLAAVRRTCGAKWLLSACIVGNQMEYVQGEYTPLFLHTNAVSIGAR